MIQGKKLMRYSTRPRLWMLIRKIQKPRKNYTAVNYDQNTMIAETQAPESRVKTQNAETQTTEFEYLFKQAVLQHDADRLLSTCQSFRNTFFVELFTIWCHNWWRHIVLKIKVWSCFNFCTVWDRVCQEKLKTENSMYIRQILDEIWHFAVGKIYSQ